MLPYPFPKKAFFIIIIVMNNKQCTIDFEKIMEILFPDEKM